MPDAPLTRYEDARLSALADLNLLEAQASPEFDLFPLLASEILAAPVAAITLVDRDTQWIKAAIGMAEPSAPRDHSICEYAILSPADILAIPDTRQDPRVFDKPCVVQDGGVRAYAGVPISSPTQFPLGALCVTDHVPRTFSADELLQLKELAAGVNSAIKLHAIAEQSRRQAEIDPAAATVAELASELKSFIGKVITPIVKKSFRNNKAKLLLTSIFARVDAPILLVDRIGSILMANSAFRSMVGYSPDEMKGMTLSQFIDLTTSDASANAKEKAEHGQIHRAKHLVGTKSGERVAVSLTSVVVEFEQQFYKVVTMIPSSRIAEETEISAEFNLYAARSIGEFRPISLAALRSALGDAWSRVSLRAMLSAERIIRKRLDRDDVVTRLDDETFAIWFNNSDRLQNDEALAIINRELRVRLLTDFGDELRTYLGSRVSHDDETLVTEPRS